MTKSQDKLLNKIKGFPSTPGVYFFVGKTGKTLYVGKATSLKNRVKSYFISNIEEKRSPLIKKMVEEATNVKYQKTDSVLEALILESSLIKKLAPPYNVADKDQKSFNFVVITKEKYPRVLLIRERNLKIQNSKLEISEAYGPFPHGAELKEALKIVRKIFPFRDKCKENQPRQCFNAEIGLCPGTCIGKVSEKEYKKTIKHIKTFFEGNKKKLVKDLEKEMKIFVKSREFEKANEIKSKIFALKHIQDVALIKNKDLSLENGNNFRIEAYDIAHTSGVNMVGVMTVLENNNPKQSDYRMFKIRGQKGADDTKALREVLERRFKHSEWRLPNLIVVDGGIAQLNAANIEIKSAGLNISLVAVTKDERHKAKEIKGIERLKDLNIEKLENQILLANSEAHRFAIKFHRKLRSKIE